MSWMILDVERYRAVVAYGSELEVELVEPWLRRLEDWGRSKGFATHKGLLEVRASRWDGDRCEIEVMRGDPTTLRPLVVDGELDTIWVVPPEPPPAVLIRHAIPAEVRR